MRASTGNVDTEDSQQLWEKTEQGRQDTEGAKNS